MTFSDRQKLRIHLTSTETENVDQLWDDSKRENPDIKKASFPGETSQKMCHPSRCVAASSHLSHEHDQWSSEPHSPKWIPSQQLDDMNEDWSSTAIVSVAVTSYVFHVLDTMVRRALYDITNVWPSTTEFSPWGWTLAYSISEYQNGQEKHLVGTPQVDPKVLRNLVIGVYRKFYQYLV